MSEPVFENNYLIINVDNIFFKAIYKNIAYHEVSYIELFKGHVIKRWKLSFILGLGITIYFIVHIFRTTQFIDPSTITDSRSYMLMYISLYVFLFFGVYILYLSLLKKPVIKIFTLDNHTYLYPLSNNKNRLLHILNFLGTCNVTLVNKLPM